MCWLRRAGIVQCTADVPYPVPGAACCLVCQVQYFCCPSPISLERKQLKMSNAHLGNAAILWNSTPYVHPYVTLHKTVKVRRLSEEMPKKVKLIVTKL